MKRLMAFGLALCMGVTALTGCTDGSASATTAAAEAQTGQAEDKAQEGAAACNNSAVCLYRGLQGSFCRFLCCSDF